MIQRSRECRVAILKFQEDFNHLMSPRSAIFVNNRIEDAFEKDPTGSQVIHVLNDLREQLTPRKN